MNNVNLLGILAFLLWWHPLAYGSTFVGNGGSWLDTALMSTLTDIETGLAMVEDFSDLDDCDNHSCEVLASLSDSQYQYAKKFFWKRRAMILKALREGSISFDWTRKNITLSDYDNRSFHAVTKGHKVILQEDVFARMDKFQRIIVIMHEINHALPWKGKVIEDKHRLGPFKGREEARLLLDMQGPILIAGMSSYNYWVEQQTYRSNPVYNISLNVRGGRSTFSESEYKRLLLDETSFSEVGVDFYPAINRSWGYHLSQRRYHSSRDELVDAKLNGVSYHGGLSHRKRLMNIIFSSTEIENRATREFWRAIAIQSKVSLGYGQFEHQISDDYNTIDGEASFYRLGATSEILLPIYAGFWFSFGVGAHWQDFKIEETNVSSKSVHYESSWGVSYGFTI
ncbi:hypothetical protein [Pseudobacteriovorax antillogorgiicola]|uniref:Uncharacterized protein n=1 Tax=Pseudobacteriovorax antillogorgiicola TaxID=1513793 RepID=A0A1Y6CAF7_9BACT|nr:hypothetical protein [Pseudobacteriovorax antillogorgiicola]TCS49085.1 hypothetical protein EDD56_116128 [Pseudobacteriovorax antillogorgiicola]SMF51899.1 hypothetical protein SAMN06296036_11626 [Pseudobacteriovorax antillogorgiicola]